VYSVVGDQDQTMRRHIALLAVIAGLLGGLVVGQVRTDYDERYAEEVDWQENRQAMRHCQSCNPDECESPTGCVAGIVKDPCQCCDVCGKAEFELCDHPQVQQHWSGLHSVGLHGGGAV